ncbi:MAG: GntR family transcriptional regulator [Chloroflexi bacterium]|nr:GntR family transcriptional regulator [Chloroflexota bacterium]
MTVTRVETLAEVLRVGMRRGLYAPGDRMIELRIAEANMVSQATVRDALRLLEREGWVVSQPRRGVMVRAFTRAEAEEVFALTASIESLALRWLFPDMNKTLRATLRGHVRAARRASQDNKTGVGLATLFEIHIALAQASAAQHPMTATILDRLHTAAQLLETVRRARTRLPPRELDPLIAGHELFCDRLDARDLNAAEETLRRQIMLYGGLVLEAMRG